MSAAPRSTLVEDRLREIVYALTRRARPTGIEVQTAIAAAREALADYRDERDDLRTSVVAFAAPYAIQHAERHGLPAGHIFSVHYDILARAGARMTDFTRVEGTRG